MSKRRLTKICLLLFLQQNQPQLEPQRHRAEGNISCRAVSAHFRGPKGLFGSHSYQGTLVGDLTTLAVSRHPSSQGCCCTQLMEDGSVPDTPTPSCTAQKPGRGLVTHCLLPSPPSPPLLHPTWETGNHTHPSQLCEKAYIFSTHSV